jgi:hypothetical protein
MFVNLTPHEIVIRCVDGDRVIGPTAPAARVQPGVLLSTENIGGVSVIRWGDGEVVSLPPPTEGVIFIVSAVVGGSPSVRGREDVLCPGTGPNDGAVRIPDGPRKGQIEAVTCLVRPS